MYCSGTSVSLHVVARHLRTPLDAPTPSARAVQDGVARWFEHFDALAREFPDLTADLKASAVEALAVFPLRLATGAPFGALAIGWDRPVHFDAELTAQPARGRSRRGGRRPTRATRRTGAVGNAAPGGEPPRD